jgi:hypothetical protein
VEALAASNVVDGIALVENTRLIRIQSARRSVTNRRTTLISRAVAKSNSA